MNSLADGGFRILNFPSDRALGVLQYRDWGVSGGWHVLGAAQGTVSVPEGKEIRLKVDQAQANALSPLRELDFDALQWLDLSSSNVTDDQLQNVQALSLLRRLDLRNTTIGDGGLANIKSLSTLKEIRLNATNITNFGLIYLKDMGRLENLWLYDTKITDQGLATLADIKSLLVVQLPKQITHEALNQLKNALPECYINIQR